MAGRAKASGWQALRHDRAECLVRLLPEGMNNFGCQMGAAMTQYQLEDPPGEGRLLTLVRENYFDLLFLVLAEYLCVKTALLARS